MKVPRKYETRPADADGYILCGVVMCRVKTGTRLVVADAFSPACVKKTGEIEPKVLHQLTRSLSRSERDGGWKVVGQNNVPRHIYKEFSPGMKLGDDDAGTDLQQDS